MSRFPVCAAALAAVVLFLGGTASAQDWTQKTPAHVPAKRTYPAMAQFSNVSQVSGATNVVMFGGLNLGSSGFFKAFNVLGDTWIWNDTDWAQLTISSSPPPRYGASMAYYPGTPNGTGGWLIPPVTVLFGGRDAQGNYLADTWLFSSRTVCFTKTICNQAFSWTQVAGSGPPGRAAARMAFSSIFYAALFGGTRGDGIILTGGFDGTNYLNDTWRFDAHLQSWQPDIFEVGLFSPGRSDTAVATCRNSLGAVLFGGFDGSFSSPLGDTWQHKATEVGGSPEWLQISPSTSPQSRFGHGMALYPVSNREVLYGGQGFISFTHTPNLPTDTWNSDCGPWTQAAPAHNPGVKSFHGMTTGPNGLSVVIFGGNNVTFPQLASGLTPNGRDSNDTWTWGHRAACLPSPESTLAVGSRVNCRFDAAAGIEFDGWSTQGFAPPATDELSVSFHTESPGAASITAYWTDDAGPQSETFTYTIAAPHR